jgi:hypothetical protein
MSRIQRTRWACMILLAAILAMGAAPRAAADSYFELRQISTKGQPFSGKDRGWTSGSLTLMNDPLRTEGWLPYRENDLIVAPNDTYYFGMDVGTPADVQHLVDLLARIEGTTRTLVLEPLQRLNPDQRLFMPWLLSGVHFEIGCQPLLDNWYDYFPDFPPGALARFHSSGHRPIAEPPTLTLQLGHPAVDLSALKVPPTIIIKYGFDDAYRAKHRGDPIGKQIEQFMAANAAQH